MGMVRVLKWLPYGASSRKLESNRTVEIGYGIVIDRGRGAPGDVLGHA
jgi:hypothetical protein